MTRIDATGTVYGRLTAVKFVSVNKHRQSLWECLCQCGNTCVVLLNQLRIGRTKSCGCISIDNCLSRSKHGQSPRSGFSDEYRAWAAMKERCYGNSEHCKKYYRGVTVCERWVNSFENFYADMGKKPSKKHSLDRINPYGNYEPSNCRWATHTQQNNNKRFHMDKLDKIASISQACVERVGVAPADYVTELTRGK